MSDDFATHQPSLTSPAAAAAEITPSDAQPLPNVTRAIYVGGAGDLRVTLVNGDIVTLSGAQAGMVYPLRVRQVMATGTTATAIVGLR
ncbi:spike base protein, RCAP_Rcc01079 family [Primorskyibacter sp. S187A]|uniref:spike base protein, RCAP_Rcc01079 family n=1 Tax=Primorskyibacter sp. S187A TaxID=3415130 RepID=UPI003C7C2EA9